MADRKTHIVVGALTGAAIGVGLAVFYYWRDKEFRYKKLLINGIKGMVYGGTASVLPDIVEPPINPFHRGFFHSRILGIIISVLSPKIFEWSKASVDLNTVLLSSIGGYMSHLILDSRTPLSLPILTREI